MLQLVLGPSGTGKSTILMKELRRRAENGQRSMLIVPEQFTSSTESRLYRELGDELSGKVISCSFTSLAEKLLTAYGGAAVRSMTDAGRVVLLQRALEASQDSLSLYKRCLRSTPFCVKCAQTLGEFKNAGVTPDQLRQLSGCTDLGKEKLSELSTIYAAYEELLRTSGMDPADRLMLAADRAEPEYFRDMAVYVDEFDTFNAPKRRLLEKILTCADEVWVALCCDGLVDGQHGLGLFSGAKQVAATLRQMAAKNGVSVKVPIQCRTDYRHAQAPALAAVAEILEGGFPDNVPKGDPALTLLHAETRAEEAKQAVAAIRRLAQQGVPWNKMALVCQDSEKYLPPLRYELRLAGIPFFFDGMTGAGQTAPLRMIRALLGLLRRGLCSTEILAVAKTGLVLLSEQKICALENYAYTWKLTAAQWREEFVNSPRGYTDRALPGDQLELAAANAARAFLVPTLDDFCKKAKGRSAAELCRLVYNTMCLLGGETMVRSMADRLTKTDGLPAGEETLRTWNLAVQLLDQLALLLGDEVLDHARFAELFELLVSTTDLGHIPQTVDSVILTTASRMRLDRPRYCFVLGLAEGEFPGAPGEQGLLTHTERDSMRLSAESRRASGEDWELICQHVEMLECYDKLLIREQVSFYKALTAASEGLWLSWSSGPDALPVTAALKGVIDTLQPPEPVLEPAELAGTAQAALDLLGQTWKADSPETAALYDVLEKQPEADSLLASIRRTAQETAFAVSDRRLMGRLLGQDMRLSPSRMERFYSCPFSYFLEYLLGARRRDKAELGADRTGSLVHYLLEQALQVKDPDFVDLTEEQIRELTDRLAEQYAAEYFPDMQPRMRHLVDRLKRSTAVVLKLIQKEQRQGSFVPVAFELKIGPDGIPARVLETVDGHKVRIEGTLDRLDAYQDGTNTWLRVVDYKTGTRTLKPEDLAAGKSCQMPIYLFTAVENGADRFPNPAAAGMLYLMADPEPAATGRDDGQQGVKYTVDGIVVDVPEVIRAMDAELGGEFSPAKMTAKGSFRKSSSVCTRQELMDLKNQTDELIVGMADRLYSGCVPTQPDTKKRGVCEYCPYRAVCGQELD